MSMHPTSRWPISLPLVALLATACATARSGPERMHLEDPHQGEDRQSLIVVGDADSFAWPALLQDLLDDHVAGSIRVLNGAIETAGIRPWNGPAGEAAARALAGVDPPARLALCMLSLRDLDGASSRASTEAARAEGEEEADEEDRRATERGADALEELARALHAAGIHRVAFATPVDPGRPPGPEGAAIAALLERGLHFVDAGPDLGAASRRYGVDMLAEDGTPNEFGVKLVAEEWYRWLTGDEAREDAVEALYARAYDVRAIAAAHARARTAQQP